MENKKLAEHKISQFLANVAVIEELAKINSNMDILKSYQGFGGLRQCFWDKRLYGRLMNAIRANVGINKEKEVLESLRSTSQSAYYTLPEIITFIYEYLIEVCNFKGGDILEPSCGNGAFFEHMPALLSSNSNVIGVEYDTLTSQLVSRIYPKIKIINNSLQNVDFAGQKFDLIIGNPPYSSEVVHDNFIPNLSGYTIHNYFIAKCVQLLKDGGILAFVMPAFYFDTIKRNTRTLIDNDVVLIDAVRLPSNLFAQATVTVDIVFFRKGGAKLHKFTQVVKYVDNNGNFDYINEFFMQNKNRILGDLQLKFVPKYNRFVIDCVVNNKDDTLAYLRNCKFSSNTFANYQKIIGTKCDIDDFTRYIGNELYDIFIEIEELEMVTRDNTRRLVGLHEKVWQMIDKLNSQN